MSSLPCLPQETSEVPEIVPLTAGEDQAHTKDCATAAARSESDPVRKFHHWTVCMVPPPLNARLWELLTAARTELRDPGLYRWPPHVNLLYPFLDSFSRNPNLDPETQLVDSDIVARLRLACEKCEPFYVRLRNFGVFGGQQRGVLWLSPECRLTEDNDWTVSPLVALQALLEEQFPMCTDQRKVSGTFQPHMTLSHFENLDAAWDGQSLLEKWWSRCDDNDIEFFLDRVYLLTRTGDEGQFKVVAEVFLGAGNTFDGVGGVTSRTIIHDSPVSFPSMPISEAVWVREQRMNLKQRRKRKSRRRG